MTGFVTFEIENREALDRAIRLASRRVSDLSIPFAMVAKDFFKSRKAIFALKGPGQYADFKGQKKEGKTDYQRFKKKKYGFDYPLLRATKRLETSITKMGAKDNIYINKGRSSRPFLEMGTSVPYAGYHHHGTKRMPRRPSLFFGPEAPRFAKGEALAGFAKRSLQTINKYVALEAGKSFAEATGTRPVVNVSEDGVNL